MRLRVEHALREKMGMGSMEESREVGDKLLEALRVMVSLILPDGGRSS